MKLHIRFNVFFLLCQARSSLKFSSRISFSNTSRYVFRCLPLPDLHFTMSVIHVLIQSLFLRTCSNHLRQLRLNATPSVHIPMHSYNDEVLILEVTLIPHIQLSIARCFLSSLDRSLFISGQHTLASMQHTRTTNFTTGEKVKRTTH